MWHDGNFFRRYTVFLYELRFLKCFVYNNLIRKKRKKSENIAKCELDHPWWEFFPIFLDEHSIDLLESHASVKSSNDLSSKKPHQSSDKWSEREDEFITEDIDLMLDMDELWLVTDNTTE